jgi:hypothetical protein
MHSAISRIKRAVLAYLNYRVNKLEALHWETGPTIPSHFENHLSDDEKGYFKQYSALLRDYSKSISSVPFDLTADL